MITGSLAAWALAMLGVPLAPSVLALAAAWVAVTFVGPFYEVTQLSYRLSVIPAGLQGRVNSSFRFLPFGVRPLAIALGGVAVDAIGARPTLWVLAGGLVLVAAAAAASSVRKL